LSSTIQLVRSHVLEIDFAKLSLLADGFLRHLRAHCSARTLRRSLTLLNSPLRTQNGCRELVTEAPILNASACDFRCNLRPVLLSPRNGLRVLIHESLIRPLAWDVLSFYLVLDVGLPRSLLNNLSFSCFHPGSSSLLNTLTLLECFLRSKAFHRALCSCSPRNTQTGCCTAECRTSQSVGVCDSVLDIFKAGTTLSWIAERSSPSHRPHDVGGHSSRLTDCSRPATKSESCTSSFECLHALHEWCGTTRKLTYRSTGLLAWRGSLF